MNIRYVSNSNNTSFSDLNKSSGVPVAEPKSDDKSAKSNIYNNNSSLKKILKWGGVALLTAGAVGLIGPKKIGDFGKNFYDKFTDSWALILKPIFPQEVGWNIENIRTKINGADVVIPTKINKFVEILNRPHWSRAIMGVGILTQPIIDLLNRNVDEDTSQVSAIRTGGKAAVGLATGIPIRFGIYKFINHFSSNKRFLDPERIFYTENRAGIDITKKILEMKKFNKENYMSVISNLLAIAIMYKTNQWLDAPMTNWVSKKLIKYRNDKKSEKEGLDNNVQPNQQPLNPQSNTVSPKYIPFTYDLCADIQNKLNNNKNSAMRGGVAQ